MVFPASRSLLPDLLSPSLAETFSPILSSSASCRRSMRELATQRVHTISWWRV
jgi:hypothetical protein